MGFRNKNNRNNRNNKKDNINIEFFNSKLAHQEMIEKSGSGIHKLINTINEYNNIIEKKNIELELAYYRIINQNREINDLEKRLVTIATTYKFKKYGIIIEFNKYRIIENIKNLYLYKFLIYKLKYYMFFITIIILLNNSYRFKLLDLNYLKNHFS